MARSTVPAVCPVQYFAKIGGTVNVEDDKKDSGTVYGWVFVELLEKGMVGAFKHWDGNIRTLLSMSHGQAKLYRNLEPGDIVFVTGKLVNQVRRGMLAMTLRAINITPIACKNYTVDEVVNAAKQPPEVIDEVPL